MDTITNGTVTKPYATTSGLTYYFKVTSTNIHGTSSDSATVNTLSAEVPATMAAVATSMDTTNVKFTWVAPATNGGTLSGYRLKVLNPNTNNYVEHASCLSIASGTLTCNIAMTALISDLSYTAGTLIKAKVEASNIKGWSTPSTANVAGEVT